MALRERAPFDTYRGQRIPDDIAERWWSVAAARWRISAQRTDSVIHPSTQHGDVIYPVGMCREHRRIWMVWRNNYYDPRTGVPWPGGATPYTFLRPEGTGPRAMHVLSEERRTHWDDKTLSQLESTEALCLSRRNCPNEHTEENT